MNTDVKIVSRIFDVIGTSSGLLPDYLNSGLVKIHSGY